MRQSAMNESRRILVLTLSFGSGHVRSAHAIAQELLRQAPDADVRVVDALASCRRLFCAAYVWPYWMMIRYAPSLWARLFAARTKRMSEHTAPAWAFRWGCPRVFEIITQFKPHTIIAAEVAACEMAALAKRTGLTQARIINVITDHEAEPVWVKPEVDRYFVPDRAVAAQLHAWGAPASSVNISGIPVDSAFHARVNARAIRARYGLTDDAPLVLLMGGGMGPTRMDKVAAQLCECKLPMHIIAVTGHDARVRRKLSRWRASVAVSLTVLGWSDDVAALMQSASLLVTKPGGLTTAEAAACHLPVVLFDAIPGPEQRNAQRFADAGAGIVTNDADETVAAVVLVLRDERARYAMSVRARELARPFAAQMIASSALDTGPEAIVTGAEARNGMKEVVGIDTKCNGPVMILTISNGAGHTRAAEAIAEALQAAEATVPVMVVDIADYMTRASRFTHVAAYLWLVKHAPALWDRIDRYQKQQTQTSPAWYYRRGCRRLFDLTRKLRPRALVATEVGCCEIAALIKHDVGLDCPLVAVNVNYDSDRAWLQREADLYCMATEEARAEMIAHGAKPQEVMTWGVPLSSQFTRPRSRAVARMNVCEWLGLNPALPMLLIAGGSEGMGRIEAVAARLLRLQRFEAQLIVLTGRNAHLKGRCEKLGRGAAAQKRVRVLGWTERVPELMSAVDLLVSKLGNTFDEAMACGLPIIALEPPPGSERVQYQLLEAWHVGRAVRTLDEMAAAVTRSLSHRNELAGMRRATHARRKLEAGAHIARWLLERTKKAQELGDLAAVETWAQARLSA